MIRPATLQKGDTLAIVAPAGIIKNQEAIHQAKALAESWGLQVLMGKHVFEKNNHFAGTDAQRLEDFQEVLNNPTVKAIWCARGGYGTARIIDYLNFETFQKQPKWIIGYSDITVLHNHVNRLGVETLHAMMPSNMEFDAESRKESVNTLKKALLENTLEYSIPPSIYNRPGNATGLLIGGNLTLVANQLGTNSALDTEGKILFLEEIGEYKYHIDRMLRALQRNGYFDNCSGLIIGGMSHIKKNTTVWGQSIEDLILDIVKDYDFPILFDFPAGHDPENRALFMGRQVEINVSETNSEVKFVN